MTLPVYAINLDRSRGRWADLAASAERAGLPLIRVPGVDGRAVAEADRIEVSEPDFRRMTGRTMRPGEYGCYRSHLAALDAIAASGAGAAIIAEDDIAFGDRFAERAEALLRACPDADVIKLFNHRTKGFRLKARSALGDGIGRCLHGPQGSAACYLVTAAGAHRLSSALRPMQLPYDVALERGWATGAEVYTVERDIAGLGALEVETEIGSREDYRRTRLPGYRRLPTHLFRVMDYARRVIYCLGP